MTDERNLQDVADARAATADSRESTADSRTATVDSRLAAAKSRASTKRSDRSAVTMILAALALLASGGLGFWQQHQNGQIQDCVRTYLDTVAGPAQARDAALQVVLDDVGNARDSKDPAAARKFYADLAAEQAAYRNLTATRAEHLPKNACPS